MGCAHSVQKALPPGSAEGKPVVKISRDCEYELIEVDPTELRKVDARVMMAEDDSALDIANQRIRAARFCMEQQRKRLASGQVVFVRGPKPDLLPGLLTKGK